jgi:hypothetical protein
LSPAASAICALVAGGSSASVSNSLVWWPIDSRMARLALSMAPAMRPANCSVVSACMPLSMIVIVVAPARSMIRRCCRYHNG